MPMTSKPARSRILADKASKALGLTCSLPSPISSRKRAVLRELCIAFSASGLEAERALVFTQHLLARQELFLELADRGKAYEGMEIADWVVLELLFEAALERGVLRLELVQVVPHCPCRRPHQAVGVDD